MKDLKDSAERALELLSEAVEYVNESRNLFRSQSLEEDCKEAITELREVLSQPEKLKTLLESEL